MKFTYKHWQNCINTNTAILKCGRTCLFFFLSEQLLPAVAKYKQNFQTLLTPKHMCGRFVCCLVVKSPSGT